MSTREFLGELEGDILSYFESLEEPVVFEEEEIKGLRPGARKIKEYSPEEIDEIRDELYEGSLIPWADNHVEDPNSGIDVRLAYDPKHTSEQRITEYVTEAKLSKNIPKALILKTPEFIFKAVIRRKLAKAIGSKAVAKAMVSGLESLPALEGEPDGPRLAEYLRGLLDNGENSALIPAHADLRDPGFGLGAIAGALGDPRYIYENFYADLNILMTIEANLKTGRFGRKKVKSLTDQLRACSKILWRIPNTGARDQWGIGTRAFMLINRGSQNILNQALEDPENGVLLATAPQQQRMVRISDPETKKLIGLAFPTKASNPEATLDGIDATIPFGFWINPEDMDKHRKKGEISWKFGSFVLRQLVDGQPESNESYLDRVMEKNRQIMEEITGLPVEYTPITKTADL